MTRRELLAFAAASATTLRARTHWDKSRISAITDEIGNSTDESIAFAQQYGQQCVEIRDRKMPGNRKEYFTLAEPEIKADAIRCAQIMGCDKVRVFTGSRVEEPPTTYSRLAETIGGEMAAIAEREKDYLLIENKMSQNIARSKELADVIKPSRWVGLNWDPHNAWGKENSFPDGYNLLPKKRIVNVQVKGKGIMPESPEKEDWKGIFRALDRDGYRGKIGLETHIFDGTLIEAANKSMAEIIPIVGEL